MMMDQGRDYQVCLILIYMYINLLRSCSFLRLGIVLLLFREDSMEPYCTIEQRFIGGSKGEDNVEMMPSRPA